MTLVIDQQSSPLHSQVALPQGSRAPVLASLRSFTCSLSRASSRSAGAGHAEADTCVSSEGVGGVAPCPLQFFPLHPMPFERRAGSEAWRSRKRNFERTRQDSSSSGRRLEDSSLVPVFQAPPWTGWWAWPQLTPVAPGGWMRHMFCWASLGQASLGRHLPTHLCGLRSHPPSWAALSTTSSKRPPVLWGVTRRARHSPP